MALRLVSSPIPHPRRVAGCPQSRALSLSGAALSLLVSLNGNAHPSPRGNLTDQNQTVAVRSRVAAPRSSPSPPGSRSCHEEPRLLSQRARGSFFLPVSLNGNAHTWH